ncbi:hypothetical protein WAI453_002189 [Rhynchosporium graminicola]
MPLINGCKYSCEPCIRGHRASSCAHTDRILIEVRKPGRPLETCGHNLNTCQCGRVAEVIAMNDILSDASAGTFGMENNSNFVVTTPPMPVGSYASIRRPKPRTKSQSKVTKRSKRKTFTPPASPVDEASSKLASISAVSQPEQPQDEILTDSTRKERLDPLSPPGQSDVNSQPMQYILPNPHQYQLLGSGQGAYMNYPSGPGGHQIIYEEPLQPLNYSRRVEDAYMGRSPNSQSQQDAHPPEYRSQYVMATQEPSWRSMR